MKHRLSCGTPLTKLSALSDYYHGEVQALAPLQVTQLETHLATCAQCRSTLHYLQQLSLHAQEDQRREETQAAQDTTWLNQLLGSLVFEARQGKTIPMQTATTSGSLDQTEGAVRTLIRSYASSPQVLIVSTKLNGDITIPGAPCELDAHLHVTWGHHIPELVQETRRKIWQLIRRHTDLNLQAVNLFVDDLAEQSEIQI